MAVFFFVVGLELKREIIAGELNSRKKAILPVAAALGGMVVPALIFLMFNNSGEAAAGWGIPMATDIAFALAVVYLLGDRVPFSLKVFLMALAIADDIGAVLVIAFFYTGSIDTGSLAHAAFYLAILLTANYLGVRNILFYSVVGIAGLWFAFLLSGVHATISAVLLAFTIPANVKVSESGFPDAIARLAVDFRNAVPNNVSTVTSEQHHILQEIRVLAKHALTPLQRLEHALHPFVSFVVMPVFALCNAGITLPGNAMEWFTSPVAMGIFLGLLIGKTTGVMGMVYLMIKLRLAELPEGVTALHILGVSVLAGIGFTMSLFVSGLAYNSNDLMLEAKLGIFSASLIAGITGYLILKRASRASEKLNQR
jgi:NhaA family Na+:H+ antiporter